MMQFMLLLCGVAAGYDVQPGRCAADDVACISDDFCDDEDDHVCLLQREFLQAQRIEGGSGGHLLQVESEDPLPGSPPGTDPEPLSIVSKVCADRQKPKWCQKNQGKCSSKKVASRCEKTCGLCESGPAPTISPTPAPDHGGACVDRKGPKYCESIQMKGYCQVDQSPYALSCKKTCGLCGDGVAPTTAPTPVPDDGGACLDRGKPKWCSGIAAKGKCGTWKKATEKCQRTCGLCGEADSTLLQVSEDDEMWEDEEMTEEDALEVDGSCADRKTPKWCQKMQQKGKCDKKKVASLCEETCGLCDDRYAPTIQPTRSPTPAPDDDRYAPTVRPTRSPTATPDTLLQVSEDAEMWEDEEMTEEDALEVHGEMSSHDEDQGCADRARQRWCSKLLAKGKCGKWPKATANCKKTCDMCGE